MKKRQLAGEESRTHDLKLGHQFAVGRVIPASSLVIDEPGTSKVLFPHQDCYFSPPHQFDDVGLTNSSADPDEALRRLLSALPDAQGGSRPPFTALRSAWVANQSLVIVSHPPASGGFVGPLGNLTYCHPPSKACGGNLLFWDLFHGPVCELASC